MQRLETTANSTRAAIVDARPGVRDGTIHAHGPSAEHFVPAIAVCLAAQTIPTPTLHCSAHSPIGAYLTHHALPLTNPQKSILAIDIVS